MLTALVVIPKDAGASLRKHLGLEQSENLRVLFIPGPGDVAGTFEHWRAGRHEPRVAVVAYSLMFH